MKVKCCRCRGKGWYYCRKNSKQELNDIKCEVCGGDGVVKFKANCYSFNALAFTFNSLTN